MKSMYGSGPDSIDLQALNALKRKYMNIFNRKKPIVENKTTVIAEPSPIVQATQIPIPDVSALQQKLNDHEKTIATLTAQLKEKEQVYKLEVEELKVKVEELKAKEQSAGQIAAMIVANTGTPNPIHIVHDQEAEGHILPIERAARINALKRQLKSEQHLGTDKGHIRPTDINR